MDQFLVSLTMRSSAVDGGGMDHFLVFLSTVRYAAMNGGGMDHLLVLLSL